MSKLPYMQFYVADWLLDMQGHSLEIRGAWITICCHLHRAKPPGTLTKPIEQWAGIIGESVETTDRIIEYIKNHKIADVTFCDGVVTIASRRMVSDEKKRASSRESTRRWREKKESVTCGDAAHALARADSDSSSLINENKNIPLRDRTIPPRDRTREFNAVWGKYPNKVGKKNARRHFDASVKTRGDIDDIHTALDNYKNSERVRKGFVQNGSTWFNNWIDWIENPEPDTKEDGWE